MNASTVKTLLFVIIAVGYITALVGLPLQRLDVIAGGIIVSFVGAVAMLLNSVREEK